MHTDRKIGFAMGILLVGVVAALFFRNEPLLRSDVPTVRREQELNARLKERDVAVYLDERTGHKGDDLDSREPAWTLRDVLKTMDERNKTQPSPVSPRQRKANAEFSAGAELDGFRTWRDEPDDQSAPSSEEVKVTTTETPNSRPLPPLTPLETPALDTEDSAPEVLDTEPPASTTKEPAAVFVPPVDFEEYVVKYGDTLSGLAERFLGSQGKYLQIFEANKDRMSSPDRLEVGKPLRIPRVSSKPAGTSL